MEWFSSATKAPRQKRSKFGNRKMVIDGITFDSILEGKRYTELKLLRRSGEIASFERQVEFSLDVNGVHICKYRADFVVRYPDGKEVVEDTKGVKTREYEHKKRLMLAIHGIKIHEIFATPKTRKKPKKRTLQ